LETWNLTLLPSDKRKERTKEEPMNGVLLFLGVSGIAALAVLSASCIIGATAGDQATANAMANEMVYGTENDELTSASAVTNAVISPNPVTETAPPFSLVQSVAQPP
jgi:hypothetical protein